MLTLFLELNSSLQDPFLAANSPDYERISGTDFLHNVLTLHELFEHLVLSALQL